MLPSQLIYLQKNDLEKLAKVAEAQIQCFPDSLSAALGKKYIQKTLEWFLDAENRFLFCIESDEKVIGFCGGFVRTRAGEGSSSGMLQFGIAEAIKAVIKKPWLCLHAEVLPMYPFILRNLFKKTSSSTTINHGFELSPSVGLVVIGVVPAFQGTGVYKQLMQEFFQQCTIRNVFKAHLSVKKKNARAIKAYEKMGWIISETHKDTFVLVRTIHA